MRNLQQLRGAVATPYQLQPEEQAQVVDAARDRDAGVPLAQGAQDQRRNRKGT